MGFAAPETRRPDLRRSYSAVVFDRASGGAGFAATIASDPVGMIEEAKRLLDCSQIGRCGNVDAVNACPRCVLAADAQHRVDKTDRRAAFELLEATLARLVLPAEHKLFGEQTVYEPAPLAVSLGNFLAEDDDAVATLYALGNPADWELEAWPITPLFKRWAGRGRRNRLAVDIEALRRVDPVTRREVVLWAERCGVDLIASEAKSSETMLLARVDGARGAQVWGSADSEAFIVGASWAAVAGAPVVRGAAVEPASAAIVDVHELLREKAREVVFEIDDQIDGPVDGFGERLKALLSTRHELADVFAEPCLELEYSDRYILSPITVRLLTDLVRALAGADTRVAVHCVTRPARNPKPDRTVLHDWPDLAVRDAVLSAKLAVVTPHVELRTASSLPHRRKLRFRALRQSGVIYFDQGVGSWSPPIDVPFDPTQDLAQQLAAMELPYVVGNTHGGTYLAVKLDP